MTKISIIQVSYKNFETTTEPCLKSLFACEEFEDLEIILVDNASGNETTSRIKQLISGKNNIKLIENSTNRGFPGGVNDGVKISSSDIIFFLGIDTQVTNGAIAKMANLIRADHKKMVGPIFNQTGNEQKIYIKPNLDKNEIIKEGLKWVSHASSNLYQTTILDFCCIGMHKKTFLTLGGMDEGFGLGYYEDTDFCMRANRLGCKLLISEDCFVYHQGSATKLNSKEQMRSSRKYFMKKHSTDAKTYLLRQRELILKRIETYIHNYECSIISRTSFLYLTSNRLKLANMLYPKNVFKKFLYFLEVRKFKQKINLLIT